MKRSLNPEPLALSPAWRDKLREGSHCVGLVDCWIDVEPDKKWKRGLHGKIAEKSRIRIRRSCHCKITSAFIRVFFRGIRAQEVINKEVLQECDLLIGIFWTRIGTPTGNLKSGTVEEIQKHIDAGKPAMLYFSQAPVVPESDQYKQLKEFRQECKQKGLIETFTDAQDFEKKFTHQLPLRTDKDKYLRSLLKSSEEFSVSQPPTLEAEELLIEICNDTAGAIAVIRFLGGMFVQTTDKRFGDEHDRKSQAAWERLSAN